MTSSRRRSFRLKGWGIAMMAMVWITAGAGMAFGDEIQELKQQLQQLQQMMSQVQQKLSTLEKQDAEKKEELADVNKRLNKAEMHTATDKLSLGVELRSRADSIHYQDMLTAPPSLFSAFFAPPPSGFNGATLAQIQQGIGQMAANGMIPPAQKSDVNNDILYTNRFRLNMNAKINDSLTFGGRMAAYKVWGDSTEVKVNGGSLGDVTFDGNTSSLPHGDTLHLERAYFNYKKYLGEVPMNFSLGRRPATEGPPLEYRNYALVGGSPLASIINWQFDGASLSFGLESLTGLPGSEFKLCYGVGFEGDWGNSYSMSASQADVEDVHLLGFIATLFDNDRTSVMLNYAHAWDITDGFTGLTVMPMIVSKGDANGDGVPEYYFQQNTGGFISRIEPSTNIGDWDAASLLWRTNLTESFGHNIDLFVAGSWSHTDPSRISANPYYEMLGQGLLSSNGDLETHDGYSIYAGAIFPMPLDARWGFEYNWGSKYWFNFTGAEDSLVGSKLATRGHVFESYYHQPIVGQTFFVTLGGQYYDYEYTGSGNPLGAPVKISEATSFDTLNAVLDQVWLVYLSATLRF